MNATDALTDGLRRKMTLLLGHPVPIGGLRRLPGGASRETWSFTAGPSGAAEGYILRRNPPEATRADRMALEAHAFEAASGAGVPVPRLLGHGDDTHEDRGVGAPYLLMERLDGETIPRRLLRDEQWSAVRPRLARELGRILGRIHGIPATALPGLPGDEPLDALFADYVACDDPRPALELGFRWLRDHRPDPVPHCVVHGDFRNGNLLVGPDGVRAVLDWELVHHGDPMEDLGWLCVKSWRFGSAQPVGGFGPREELFDGYAEVRGFQPDPDVVHWWEVFGTVRWAVLCQYQARRHLSGRETSVELAVLGRRVCESEHDLLLALGLRRPRQVADPLDDAAPAGGGLHGRPTWDELLDAVAGYLSEDLATQDERVRFHAKVATNALAITRRELLLGEAQAEEHARRLATLGCAADAELAEAIRNEVLDYRRDDVVDVVSASVEDKLLVANPRYLAQPG